MSPAGRAVHVDDADDAPLDAGMVDWAVADRVARWFIARRPAPAPVTAPLERSFAEATARAEDLVAAATGWRAETPARSVVTDRPGWVRANIASFQRLLGPTLVKLEQRRDARRASRAGWLPGLPAPISERLTGAGRSVSGAQLGAVLAWMSTRVLGQYDLLLTDELADDQDILYYVGPNVVELEERFGFVPTQFRLWLALHEVTHRCQFSAVPWLRDHFLSLVDTAIEPFQADPGRVAEVVRRAAEQVRSGRSPLDDAGVLGLVATERQLEAIRGLQAMMSLLEGHGDVTMDRAGADEVPGAARFSRVLRERREAVTGPARVLQQVLGLEAKMRQYRQGEEFIHAVELAGGPQLLERVWRDPEWLPTLDEIREPGRWIDRVGAAPQPA